MELIGYILSVFIGISLGLIGGGGSILTVPLLVYIFHIEASIATAYSLFIVGISSAAGSLVYFKEKLVNMKAAVIFGIPSIIAVFIARVYVLPIVPNELFSIADYVVTKNRLLMLMFALLMLAASRSMIKKSSNIGEQSNEAIQLNYLLIFMQGAIEGTLTGFVGAGGGFIIIPALVILSKLPMKEAVGTSLIIIAVKSLIGFWGASFHTATDWHFIVRIAIFALIGIVLGTSISKKIDGTKLKPAFGWFVLVMGIYILIKETVLN
jgi:hypothetical protein